ncbi:glycosyltransferase family 22 protein [Jaapia argillacea MUCL 33604]|uniref:Mannosyltransferase n=1 Tax=Jaapia argillacea MUCL 33604 TaxID=933084 RepID=A0A067Q480_9AGAM|nr:glycosyltransferase family 22 protein [Jaapia argillacea MUCL 33604]
MQTVTLFALCLRVLIALLTRTFFSADAYFQSLEVAHRAVYGFGHLTWEWRTARPIRNILYPALNIPVYWLLKILKLDHTSLLISGPKVLHGILAAGTDIWLPDLTRKVLGERYVQNAVFLSFTSFFHALSLSRSNSNSLETTLTTIALSYYPWDSAIAGVRKCLALAALTCVMRPTNAVLWVYAMGALLWHLRRRVRDLLSVIVDAATVGLTTVMLIFLLDSAYYGQPTFTPLNFFLTNLSSVSLFYGTSPWHYYLSQGFPLLCTTCLPFVLHGAWLVLGPSGTPPSRLMLGLIVWTVGIYSLAGHKEWRFLHPLLPLLHILASKSLTDAFAPAPSDSTRSPIRLPRIRTPYLGFLLLTVPASIYVAMFHARAPISVMYYLRDIPAIELDTVGFLMPCHSTPWQAYLHQVELADNGRLWALGCEPPLHKQNISEYQSQADIFYNSPVAYLKERFPAEVDVTFPPSPFPSCVPGEAPDDRWRHEWPRYLVMFGALLDEEGVREAIEGKGYAEVWIGTDGWEGDARRRGGVRVWKY